jgi:hypothetical protein
MALGPKADQKFAGSAIKTARVPALRASLARCSCRQTGERADGAGRRADDPPQTATLTTDGVTPARQVYLVEGAYDDGSKDVSDSAIFSLSNTALGSMFGGFAQPDRRHEITAAHAALRERGGARGPEEDRRVPRRRRHRTGRSGEVVGRAPEIRARTGLVYPNDGVMLPLNLGSTKCIRPGPGNTLFKSLSSARDASLYTLRATQDGCVLNVDGTTWDASR